MHKRDGFQFTLVVFTLILTGATLLYGWVYLDSLNHKFQTVMLSPFNEKDQRIAALEEKNQMLTDRLTAVEGKLAAVNNDLSFYLKSGSNTATSGDEETELSIDHPDKKEVFIDEKCFSDPDYLNQCAVLARADLTDNITVLVRPVDNITNSEVNEIVFQFLENETPYTELKISTANLFNTNESIANIVYLRKHDITLQTRVGLNNVSTVYNYDGEGWIDYSRFTENSQQ